MKIESNKNWTTCLRLNTGDGSPRVFLLNSHFLGSVPENFYRFFSLFNANPRILHRDFPNRAQLVFLLKTRMLLYNTFPFLKAMNGLSINSIDRIISFKVFSLLSNRLLSLPSSVSLL